jgi:hypothetical protein
MAGAGWDLVRRQAAPIDVPVGKTHQPVALLGVEGNDGVARARAPEKHGEVAREHGPDFAADAFALGLAIHRELAEIGRDVRVAEERGAQVVLFQVHVFRLRDHQAAVLHGAGHEGAAEG